MGMGRKDWWLVGGLVIMMMIMGEGGGGGLSVLGCRADVLGQGWTCEKGWWMGLV